MHTFLVFDKPIVYHLENDKQVEELCSFGGQFCQDLETLTKTVLYSSSRLSRTLSSSQPLSCIKSLLLPRDLGWVSSGLCLLKISCN